MAGGVKGDRIDGISEIKLARDLIKQNIYFFMIYYLALLIYTNFQTQTKSGSQAARFSATFISCGL